MLGGDEGERCKRRDEEGAADDARDEGALRPPCGDAMGCVLGQSFSLGGRGSLRATSIEILPEAPRAIPVCFWLLHSGKTSTVFPVRIY